MRFNIQKQTEIAKAPSDVYRFIATDHATSHVRWDAWLVDFKQLDPGPVAVGTRFAYKRKALGPITQTMELEVTEMQVDRRFSFRLKSSTTSNISYTLQPTGGGATTVQFDGRFETRGPQLLAGLLRGTIDHQIADGQHRIKQLVEAGS